MDMKERIGVVMEKILSAAQRAGRSGEEITLVAVSKNHPAELVKEAYNLGVKNFGENRAQEMKEKYEVLRGLPITWHFIGRIQTNKVKYFVKIADYVHSICREKELLEIEKRAAQLDKKIKGFIEVNISGEDTKAGLRPEEVVGLLKVARELEHIEIIGLMTMAPYVEDPESVRWVFRELRKLRDRLSKDFPNLTELSMGMSNDFEIAIEEGSTFVRIGTAIFGKR